VEAFLAGRLPFTGIAEVIDQVLGEANVEPLTSLEQVYAADVEARALASRYVSRMTQRLPPTADRIVS
jgi:1-deoxy-D-xylulose-5-phosphate reductoisomerase